MPDWRVETYVDDAGRSPVETFLDRLPADDRARIIRTVEMLTGFRPPTQPTVCEASGKQALGAESPGRAQGLSRNLLTSAASDSFCCMLS